MRKQKYQILILKDISSDKKTFTLEILNSLKDIIEFSTDLGTISSTPLTIQSNSLFEISGTKIVLKDGQVINSSDCVSVDVDINYISTCSVLTCNLLHYDVGFSTGLPLESYPYYIYYDTNNSQNPRLCYS